MDNEMRVILIILGAILYRLGGASHSDYPKLPKWLVKSYTRDIGVTLLTILYLTVLGKYHWSLWGCGLLTWGAITTYHKWLNKYFGDTTEDAHWYNWFAHGLVIGLSLIPYGVITNTLPMVICRSLLMGFVMAIWCECQSDVEIEEGFRGAVIVGSLW